MTTVTEAEQGAVAGVRRRQLLARLGPFLGLIAVIAIFALLTDSPAQYLSVRNLRIVVAQTVIVALGAIGMTMIIVSGGIDLSVGSAIALTGVVTALGLRDGMAAAARAAGRRRRRRRRSASSTASIDHAAAGHPVHRHARHARHGARRREVARRPADGERAADMDQRARVTLPAARGWSSRQASG